MLKGFKKNINYLILFALAATFTCCSPKNKFKVLSFLFDGVPQEVASDSISKPIKAIVADTTINKEVVAEIKTTASIHPPFKENNCKACHDQYAVNFSSAPLQKICYQCHDDFGTKFTFLHGPVASGYCIGCHNPHNADLPKLLKRKDQDVCLYCHTIKDIKQNEVHTDIGTANCTECHNPHGGDNQYFL